MKYLLDAVESSEPFALESSFISDLLELLPLVTLLFIDKSSPSVGKMVVSAIVVSPSSFSDTVVPTDEVGCLTGVLN